VGGVANEWVTQLLWQGGAKVFKKYSHTGNSLDRTTRDLLVARSFNVISAPGIAMPGSSVTEPAIVPVAVWACANGWISGIARGPQRYNYLVDIDFMGDSRGELAR